MDLPLEETTYPPVAKTDGEQMNAMNDYVIRISKDGLPSSKIFWSLTLYDLQNGFFVFADHKKKEI